MQKWKCSKNPKKKISEITEPEAPQTQNPSRGHHRSEINSPSIAKSKIHILSTFWPNINPDIFDKNYEKYENTDIWDLWKIRKII